jgi:glycosyltransferase involved in cell wall biosynthesis
MTLGLEINYRGGVYDLDRLADYYLGAKYFIFPSRYDQEALPLVIMEAMACGCVVISSNVGGVSGLIDSGFDGLTLDDCSPENIALTILELEDNNELTEALSVNARIKAKEWTETRYVDRVQEVIDFYILKQRRGYGKA